MTICSVESLILVDMRNGTTYAAPPRTRREIQTLVDRVVERVAAMSPRQRFGTMVRAGIYTKSGKLRKQYGGTG